MRAKLATAGMLAAITFVSTAAVAQRNLPRDSNSANVTAQNDSRGKIQKQTSPRKNGTDESESMNGRNKNGQPQK